MNQKRKIGKRISSLLLSVVLCISLFSTVVLAAENQTIYMINHFDFTVDASVLAFHNGQTAADYEANIKNYSNLQATEGSEGWTVGDLSKVRLVDSSNKLVTGTLSSSSVYWLRVPVVATTSNYVIAAGQCTVSINGGADKSTVSENLGYVQIPVGGEILISEINVNVTEPTVGADITKLVPTLTSSNMQIESYEWYCTGEGDSTDSRNSATAFELDKNYLLFMTVKASSGYCFAPARKDTVGSVNGNKVAVGGSDNIVSLAYHIKLRSEGHNEYPIMVENGTAKVNGAKTEWGLTGTTVNLVADPAPEGMVFDKWEITGATVSEIQSQSLSFTMPKNTVSAKAKYKHVLETKTQINHFDFTANTKALVFTDGQLASSYETNIKNNSNIKAAASASGWTVGDLSKAYVVDISENRVTGTLSGNTAYWLCVPVVPSSSEYVIGAAQASYTMNGGASRTTIVSKIGSYVQIRISSKEVIEDIDVSVTEPIVGMSYTKYKPTLASSNMRIVNYQWYYTGEGDSTGGRYEFDTFENGKNYALFLRVEPETGYEFSLAMNETIAKVNGKEAEISGSSDYAYILYHITMKEFYAFDKETGILTITGDIPEMRYDEFPWYEDGDLIKEVVVEEGVTSIASNAFADCKNLTKVTLPSTLTSMSDAFKGSGITSITIPEGVTEIPAWAFYRCNSLTGIRLPGTIQKIGSMALYVDKPALVTINYNGTEADWAKINIDSTNNIPKQGTIIYKHDHTGGTATCTAKAKCEFCGAEYGSLAAHTFAWVIDKEATTTATGLKHEECTVCGYKKAAVTIDKLPVAHTHSGTKVSEKAATCTSYGVKAYYKCSCGKYYTDLACTKEITDLATWKTGDGKIAKKAHTGGTATCTAKAKCSTCGTEYGSLAAHTYDTKWSTDGTNHWHACTVCGNKKDSAAHTLKTTTVTKATTTNNGKQETKCTVCNKVTKTATIYAAKTIKLSATTYTYDGKVKKPSVTVKNSAGTTLKKDTAYTATYASGRKAVGKYKVTIKGKGKYSFTKTLTFKINPVKTSISSLTKGTKSFTVKWAKKTTQTTGYEIQYSTSSTFKAGTATKKVTVTSNKTTSKTIKSLKAKQKYYVRVRTYKTVNGTKYYSAWCTKKYVTTK